MIIHLAYINSLQSIETETFPDLTRFTMDFTTLASSKSVGM